MSLLVNLVNVTCFATFVATHMALSHDRNDIHLQCVQRGYAGACKVKHYTSEFFEQFCGHLTCGKAIKGNFVAFDTGRANDGTYCGPNFACKRAKCEERTKIVSPGGTGATLNCVRP